MSCVFCKIVEGRAPSYQIYQDEEFLAFLDIYPVRPGHTLLIPRQHGQHLADFDPATPGRLFALASQIGAAIRRSPLPCDGLNYLLNDGAAANQTVPHLHLHLLPRTRPDLHRVARKLLQRPVQALLGQAPEPLLQQTAATIRAAL